MKQITEDAYSRIVEGLRGSTLGSCLRWSAARRWMPEKNNVPAGWYSSLDYPWVKEILESRAAESWIMKAAQTGLTECGINRGFFEVDFHHHDTMYLLPTDRVANVFSRTRLANAIALSPYLKERTIDTVEFKQIGTNCLYIRGANGDINVKSTPVSRLIIDEVDEMQERQIWLALERLSGCSDKMVWGMSTPTLPNFGIHKLYIRSTQELFFFDCPHCGKEIDLKWPDSFEVRGTSSDDMDCRDSFIKCYLCQGKLPHDQKRKWLSTGRWKPTSNDRDPNIRGFHLNQMYSPTVSPGEIARHYHRGLGDEDARREFHNSKLGQPYVEDGAQVGDAHIDACLRDYTRDAELPKLGDQSMITLGIDQGAFHHWAAVKWTIDKSKLGDCNDRAIGKVIGFGKILQEDWDSVASLMRMYQVKCAVVDYFPDPTCPRKFARKFPGYVWLCQYVVGRGAREISLSEDDFGASIVKVDKTGWISKTLGRIMQTEIHLPRDINLEFRSHLKNQVRTYKRGADGNYQAEYARIDADHYAHALNYAEIALRVLDPPLHDDRPISAYR